MKTSETVTVSQLDRPEHHGDWHDKPCKWQAVGPVTEVQKFSTRKDAELYARLRRKLNRVDAGNAFVAA